MTRLGYVVVELDADTRKPSGRTTAFAWDGGELCRTVEEARAEAVHATTESGGGRYVYAAAEVLLAPEETA